MLARRRTARMKEPSVALSLAGPSDDEQLRAGAAGPAPVETRAARRLPGTSLGSADQIAARIACEFSASCRRGAVRHRAARIACEYLQVRQAVVHTKLAYK
jgi:hypothetical protein